MLQFGGRAVAPFLHGPERVAALDDQAPLVVVLFLVAVGVPDRGVGGGVVLEPGIEDAAVAPGVDAAGRGAGAVVLKVEVEPGTEGFAGEQVAGVGEAGGVAQRVGGARQVAGRIDKGGDS